MARGVLLFQATNWGGVICYAVIANWYISLPSDWASLCLPPPCTLFDFPKCKYDFEISPIKNMLWFSIAFRITFKFFSVYKDSVFTCRLWKSTLEYCLLWRSQSQVPILALWLIIGVTSVLSPPIYKIRTQISYWTRAYWELTPCRICTRYKGHNKK